MCIFDHLLDLWQPKESSDTAAADVGLCLELLLLLSCCHSQDNKVSREKKKKRHKSTLKSVFSSLHVPFILCMCEKHLKCFFPPLLCKYEYEKKCQDVLGEAVDIREVEDYFLEIHCLMIVSMFCICQGQDRRSDVLLCCWNNQLNADLLHQHNSRGHLAVSTACRLGCRFLPHVF